jgi:PAS domain S-box-containing protein
MNMLSPLEDFFNSSYMPHGHCYFWKPEILWTHVISDVMIAASYFSIPILLFYIISKRDDWQFKGIFILFSAFIFLCGITHIVSIFTIWNGIYGIHGLTKAATAIVSFITATALMGLAPKILSLPTVKEIEESKERLLKEKALSAHLENERENQRFLSTMFDVAPIGLLVINQQGVIKMVNQELLNFTDYSEKELLSESPMILFKSAQDSVSINQFKAFLDDVSEDSLQATLEFVGRNYLRAMRRDGSVVPVSAKMKSVNLGGERLVVVSLVDLSSQMQAEDAQTYLSAIVESSDDAIVAKTLDGVITHWNKAAQNLYQYTDKEMIGQSVNKIIPEEIRGELEDILLKIKHEHKVDQYETVHLKKDSSLVEVLITISPIKNAQGEVIGASAITKDISEQKKRTEEILLQKNKALQSSNDELQHFAFIASHDLNEPLRKIHSFGSLLLQGDYGKLDARGEEYLEYMLSAATRMSSLLDSLLSYSRVISKAKPFEAVDLNQTLIAVLDDLEIAIRDANGAVDVDELPTIQAEPAQMRQLFQNLIGNSLKYAKSDEAPVINITAELSKHNVTIEIADNGIGFEPEYTSQVFEMFRRLHGRKEYSGTGVGLAICKKIVERHGGSIKAIGEPNKGAIFIIKLPINSHS